MFRALLANGMIQGWLRPWTQQGNQILLEVVDVSIQIYKYTCTCNALH